VDSNHQYRVAQPSLPRGPHVGSTCFPPMEKAARTKPTSPGSRASSAGTSALRSTIPPLDLDGAAHRIDDARKLHQHAIAGSLDDAAVMFPDFRIDKLAAVRLQAIEGTLFVRSEPGFSLLIPAYPPATTIRANPPPHPPPGLSVKIRSQKTYIQRHEGGRKS
jgi:hypothetical protein